MEDLTEAQLLRAALERLRQLLPEQFQLAEPSIDAAGPFTDGEALWSLQEQNSGYGDLLVQAKLRFTPRDVDRVLGGLPDIVRQALRQPTVLVVAPWLSPRARRALEERGFSYIDLTGNVLFKVNRPAVYIMLQGADRDPNPPPRAPAGLQGPKARRLARLLVDVVPPYRLTDLAYASGMTQGYVSRLLGALDDQALIERDRRGLVENVDWPALLRAGAEHYDLFKNNSTSLFVAPTGAPALYSRLKDGTAPGAVVTGSYAAVAVAAVAAPAQLVLYTSNPDRIRQDGRLLPADRGADVALLTPADQSQLERARSVDGTRHVGLSQLVMDCLAGNGRLPEEGQAVMDWMRQHERDWRLPELPPPDR